MVELLDQLEKKNGLFAGALLFSSGSIYKRYQHRIYDSNASQAAAVAAAAVLS